MLYRHDSYPTNITTCGDANSYVSHMINVLVSYVLHLFGFPHTQTTDTILYSKHVI